MATTRFSADGIHCSSCGELIKEICLEQRGAIACRVDVAAKRGEVEHDDTFDFEAFATEVKANGGYSLAIID